MGNEMFIRDSAFKLFKAINCAPVPEKASKEKKEDKKEEVVVDKKDDSNNMDTETGEEEKKSEEKPREASVEITAEEKKVMVTKNKDLLFGCSYFDLNHSGYIETKDLEDLFFPLELDLSRAEIKKIANKLAVKDQVNYRALTDGEADVETTPEEENTEEMNEMAKGFKKYIPGKEAEREESQVEGGLVRYKGSVLDVAKLQQKLDKSEKVRAATDLSLIDLQKKFSGLKETHEKVEKTKEKLGSDLRDSRKRVRGLEEDLTSSQKEATKYLAVLTEVFGRVMPIVSPPEKTEEKGTETVPQVNGLDSDGESKDSTPTMVIEEVATVSEKTN